MFIVRPIQDKKLQKQLCDEFNIKYNKSALAYFAADLKRDGSEVDKYIGICQFIFDKNGVILNLKAAPGRDDDEAMIVMLRTVMSFMSRCEIKTAVFACDAVSEELLEKSKFTENGGVYSIDLEKFYLSPCSF